MLVKCFTNLTPHFVSTTLCWRINYTYNQKNTYTIFCQAIWKYTSFLHVAKCDYYLFPQYKHSHPHWCPFFVIVCYSSDFWISGKTKTHSYLVPIIFATKVVFLFSKIPKFYDTIIVLELIQQLYLNFLLLILLCPFIFLSKFTNLSLATILFTN